MQQPRPFWFLLDAYGWVVFLMSLITAYLIQQWWIVLVGVAGYLLALLLDLAGGRSLGRTGAMRLAQAEQENRELKSEQVRLVGTIRELETKLAAAPATQPANENLTGKDKETTA